MSYNENIDITELEEHEEIKICCCSPELPHDETMKLRLIFLDDNQKIGDNIIFPWLDAGSVKQLNQRFFAGTTFRDCQVIGRNKLIYTMYNGIVIEGIRICYLAGESGSGKSDLAKHLSNYLEERGKILDARYVNLDHSNSLTAVAAKIAAMSLPNEYYPNRNRLIILDHCNSLVINQLMGFREELLNAVMGSAVTFIVLTYNRDVLEKGLLLSAREKVFSLGPLDTRSSCKFLINAARDHLPLLFRNPRYLENHPLFKNSSGFYPKQLVEITLKLRSGIALDDLQRSFEAQNILKSRSDKYDPSEVEEDGYRISYLRYCRNLNI